MDCHRSAVALFIFILFIICTVTHSTPLEQDSIGHLKIVEGKNAEPGRWPWQALILIRKKNQKKLSMCGGALIHESWVITAAHCVINYAKIKIYFGVWNVTAPSEEGRVQVEPMPNRVHINPCYDDVHAAEEAGINLALIKLKKPVVRYRPVCLEDQHTWRSLKNGKTISGCVATGYGKETNGKRAHILQEVQFSNTSTDSCKRSYSGAMTDNTVCAFDNRRTTKDACSGDIGGPLVCPTSRFNCNGFFLLGVTIAGNSPCGGDITGRPGIYAAIDPNLEWLRYEMSRKHAQRRTKVSAIFCHPKVQIKQTKLQKQNGTKMRDHQTSDAIM